MIEDTTYPMPYDRVQGVWLNNVSIMIAGENKSLSFDRNAGYYALVLDAPAPEASVLVVPNDAGAAIEIDGQAGVAGNVDLNFGVDNMVEMRVTGAGGWQGLYRLAITVPVPKPLALEVPGNATYGIGDQLDFTVTYDYAVEADEDNPPALPILLDGGEELAVYSGQPVGEPEKLTFRYTVLEGDEGVRGIQLGDALVSSSPGAIVGAGDPAAASMELPGVLPVTSGVVIDGIKPSITLTPSTTSSTRNPVTVEADVDGTGSAIDELKFGEGIRDISYFADSGTPISGGEFVATDNGNYTVYARDSAGNEQVEIVAIANIVTANPTVLLDYSPKTPTRGPVDVAVTVTVSDVAGNKLEQLKWAAGELAADDFSADPTLGADAAGGLFSVSANGDYTVYAIDSAGNEQVETIGIANITTTNPTILLDYSPKMPTNSQIEVTVTASVYEAADNKLEVLKWAAGELEVGDFNADPTLGADVTGSLFSLSENGEYTVYAVDSAGNEQVETIEISNIVTAKPMILLDYSPMTPTRGMVDVGVTASVTDAAGNKLEELRWAAGERNAGDFSADPTLGAEVAGGLFSVSANGKYTVYAVDTAGNEQTETIEINHIDNSVPVINPNMRQFLIDPNRDNTVSFDGLTLFIPAGAVDQFTYITVENVTDAAKRLMKEDQKLLGKGYKLTKNTQGHFKLPITLSMEWTGEELGIDQRPVVAYYDEAAKQWVALKGKREGSLLAGETDHFTVFAAITADADRPAISDINGHWGEKSIREAVETGLVDGYPDGAFRPDQQVTRAEFATMLHRMFAWPNGPDAGFNDQSEILPWAREAVSAAVKAGVVSGYPDGTFRPAADVNRVEAVVMIAKAAGLQADKNVLAPFADDAAIASWAKPYIDAAHEAGLVEGQSGNRFNPQAAMTRAEAVVLLLRLADYR